MSTADETKPVTDEEDNSECIVNGSSTESDEDDQESSSYAMGYMPLSQDPDLEDDNEDNCPVSAYDPQTTEGTVITDEGEQTRHPQSPEECTCTPASQLEDNQVDQIKQVMSGFSLPPSAIPEWAKHVPENVWKSELINGIRTKQDDK